MKEKKRVLTNTRQWATSIELTGEVARIHVEKSTTNDIVGIRQCHTDIAEQLLSRYAKLWVGTLLLIKTRNSHEK